jgi:DNA-binding PadR family transcriptional regulator
LKRKTKRIDPSLAKVVLAELSKGPLRRRDLHKRTLRQCGTPATFTSTLNYLKQRGHVEKMSTKHTAPYRITEKGKRFLEGL